MLRGYFITVVGLICFMEGLPYLASPVWLKGWLQKILSMRDRHLRILGAVLMLLGLIFVYFGRHYGG